MEKKSFQTFLYVFLFILGTNLLHVIPVHADTLAVAVRYVDNTSSPDSLLAQSEYSLKKEDYITALRYLQEGVDMPSLSQQQKAEFYHQLGLTYRHLSIYPKALTYLEKLISMKPKSSRHNEGLILMGTIYKNQGEFDRAFSLYMDVLQEYENAQDTFSLARINYNLGSLFYYQNNYEKALEYYEQTFLLADKVNHQRMIFNSLSARGATYEAMGLLDKAITYNQCAMQIAVELEYQTGLAYAFHNLGSNYLTQKKYTLALEQFQKSLVIKQKVNDNWGIIGTRISLADVYENLQQLDKALLELEAVEKLAKQVNARTRLLTIYDKFAGYYEQKGQLQESNTYLRQLLTLSDSIFNEETTSKMSAAQTRYEVETRDVEISILKKENELLEKDKRINFLMLLLSFVAILFAIVVVFLTRRSLLVERIYSDKLNLKNAEIEQQVIALEDSNQSLENFAYMASHDLREPLRMIKSFSTILEKRHAQNLGTSGQEYLGFIKNGAERMDALLVNLLNFSRLNNQNTDFLPVSIGDVLMKTINGLQVIINEKQVKLELDYASFPSVMGNASLLGQLFQNLIANGIKFNQNTNLVIEIGCIEKEAEYCFFVKDNGIGISPENQRKIFQMFQRLHSRQEFEGTGIGLATCRKIVALHKGKIWVESVIGEGSTFFFTITNKVATVVEA